MFDFSHLNDSQLMELIDQIPTFAQIGDDAETWKTLQAEWLSAAQADLTRRQTRRIAVEIRCLVVGHSYLDSQVFTGTTREFAAAFGMSPKDRPFMPTGRATGYDVDGRPCEMAWEPADG